MKAKPVFTVLKGFLVFEGLDGAGTTTQSRILHERMTRHGTSSMLTTEPTETFIGKAVRHILRNNSEVAPGTLAKLFSTDRHNHLYHRTDGIVSHLENGTIVICDRYLFSSLAYQSIDWDFDAVWDLNCGFPLPEHLFFLDVPPEESQRRILKRDTPQEIYEKQDLQNEIRENYFHTFTLFEHTEMKLHILDGTLPVKELEEMVWKKVKPSDI